MLQRFFPKLKKNDLLVHGIVLLGLAGMALILLSSLGSRTSREEQQPEPVSAADAQEAYRSALQAELQELLGNVAGVGRVQVLVTLGGSEEYRYAKEDERLVTDEQTRSSTTYVTVGGSSREALLESVAFPSVVGVVVACDGGGSSTVQEAVYRTVSVACGLPTTRIYVTRLEPYA